MELRVLNYFLAIAREENMTKAAQMLHVSQPALSRQMVQLEDELGVKLFNRSNHNIVLTEDGLLLKRRARNCCPLQTKQNAIFFIRMRRWQGRSQLAAENSAAQESLQELWSLFGKNIRWCDFKFTAATLIMSRIISNGAFWIWA